MYITDQSSQDIRRGDKISYVTPKEENKTGVFLQPYENKFAVLDDKGFIDIVEEIIKQP